MKYHYRMPICYKRETNKISDLIDKLLPIQKSQALKFIQKHGIKKLCVIIYSIRGWYSAWSYSHAERLYKNYNALNEIMDLKPPLGLVRGMRIYRNNKKENDIKIEDLENWKEGDVICLSVTRNRGVASFTKNMKIARKFSGKTKKYAGLLVKLEDLPCDGKVLLAPPSKTKKWFNNLYRELIGTSFREKEEEYVIKSDKIKIKILKINM